MNDVKDFFKNDVLQKRRQRGYNSFVANDFLDQIQLDIADFTKNAEKNDSYRYALVGIDVFSRYGWAVKMKTKQPHDLIMAFKEIMRVIGVPSSTFSHMEGSILSTACVQVLNQNNIKQITTLNHALYAEVFIRSLKQMIHNRLEGEDR